MRDEYSLNYLFLSVKFIGVTNFIYISASLAWTENQEANWGFFEGLLQGCHGLLKTATLQSLKLFG